MSINRVCITGNLTKDAELRTSSGGTQILNFGVAVNERRKDRSGEWVDSPSFIDCVMFGNRAEAVARFLTKGAKVAVDGKLRQSRWESDDGTKRSKIEVVVDDVDLMQRRDGQAEQRPARAQAPASWGQPQRPQPADELYAEDIPF